MPSGADQAACDASRRPWFILGADGLHRLDPSGYSLEGRMFDFGWSDCWTLVRDYHGATMPDFPRVWGTVEGLFEQHLHAQGFVPVDTMEPGDVLAMQVRGHGINHLAVYLGDGQILHHAVGQLSRKVPLGEGINRVRLILRSPSC
jgi:cell wall-associated NlpC family hydrolase